MAIQEQRKEAHDKERFFANLTRTKDLLDEVEEDLSPVTMWEEDATMNDWSIPAEFEAHLGDVMRIVRRIDKLRSAANKISRARK